MRTQYYARLIAIARRCSRVEAEAADLVQDALLEAVRQGRGDLAEPQNLKWVAGIIRNRARLEARTALRRKRRETEWSASRDAAPPGDSDDVARILADLPPALKSVCALALSGHNRREIAYLLDLSDTALRQRIVSLKRALKAAGFAMPPGLPGLNLDLAYGHIRDCLLPGLLRHGGVFASHDPDGHLFIVTRSRNP